MPDAPALLTRLARAFVDSQRFRKQELPEIPVVSVTGDFTDDVVTMRSTAISAILLHGRSMDTREEVLAPFAHMHLESFATGIDEDGEPETLLKEFMPFENAAFVVASLAADLRIACSQLARSGSPAISIERKRLEAARIMASNAAHESLTAVAWLSEMLERKADAPAQAPKRRIAAGKPAGHTPKIEVTRARSAGPAPAGTKTRRTKPSD